jgi:hypothetical protein
VHPAWEQLQQPKAGFHTFRRYRLTWLRKNRVRADLERFWIGHENETVGLGFTLPPKIADVVRIVRKNEAKPRVENAA